MDALSLAIPAGPTAKPGSNGPDSLVLGGPEEDAPAGFAALLAAGLVQQQDVAAFAGLPKAQGQSTEHGRDDDEAAATAADGAAGLAAAAVPIHLQLTHAALAPGKGDHLAAATGAVAGVAGAGAHPNQATMLAAQTATIAANAADDVSSVLPEHAIDRLEATQAGPESDASAADGPTSLGHAMHLGAPERAQPHHPTAVLEVSAPVHSPDFGQSLSQQVVWMTDKDVQVAELHINPPDLGPVEVRLHLSGDEASVQFTSAHAEVRGAIESALARLRESMAQAGIQLGDASVSAESFRQQSAHYSGSGEGRDGYRTSAEPGERVWSRTPIAEGVRRGLVDLFA